MSAKVDFYLGSKKENSGKITHFNDIFQDCANKNLRLYSCVTSCDLVRRQLFFEFNNHNFAEATSLK